MKATKTEQALAVQVISMLVKVEDRMIALGAPHQRYTGDSRLSEEWMTEMAIKAVRRVKRGTSDTSPFDRAAHMVLHNETP